MQNLERIALLGCLALAFVLSSGCSRSGLCVEPYPCEECETDDDCLTGRCITGVCFAPDEVVFHPDIEAEPNPVDFGRVSEGDEARALLTVRNLGDAKLDITELFILGGQEFSISDASRAELPISVDQGDSRDIELVFLSNAEGFHEAEILIRSNDPDEGDLLVPLIANATEPCLQVEPDEAIDFGTRRINREYEQEVVITNCAHPDFGEPLDVSEWFLVREPEQTTSRNFSLRGNEPPAQLMPQESVTTTVVWAPDELLTLDEGWLRIRSNDVTRDPLEIPIRGFRVGQRLPDCCRTVPHGSDAAVRTGGASRARSIRWSAPLGTAKTWTVRLSHTTGTCYSRPSGSTAHARACRQRPRSDALSRSGRNVRDRSGCHRRPGDRVVRYEHRRGAGGPGRGHSRAARLGYSGGSGLRAETVRTSICISCIRTGTGSISGSTATSGIESRIGANVVTARTTRRSISTTPTVGGRRTST